MLTLTAQELDDLAGITFQTLPTADTPLLINVTGASFDGTLPNLAGISRDQAPFILWNFPDATQVRVTGGDSLKGTLYAPRAAVRWETTINMEGNVIAASLVHGDQRVAGHSLRELHDEPFAALLSCEAAPEPSITPEPSPSRTSTPTVSVAPDDTETDPEGVLPWTGPAGLGGLAALAAVLAGLGAAVLVSRRGA